jgi:hypothetical protein
VRIALFLFAVLMAGCPKAGVDKAETATAAPSPPWWMSLKDGHVHRGLDEAPIGLYVTGDKTDRFQPSGDVEGSGPVAATGEAGALDLVSGKFTKDSEPKPPPPYVDGAMTPSGFSPSSRKVHY